MPDDGKRAHGKHKKRQDSMKDTEISIPWLKNTLKQHQDTLDMQQGQIEALAVLCGRLIAKHEDWKALLDILKNFSHFATRQTNQATYLNGMLSTVQSLCDSAEAIRACSPHSEQKSQEDPMDGL
jgi:phosphoribosylformylglycinamidine (FGAM) synthase-like amidotransferase family enzyme